MLHPHSAFFRSPIDTRILSLLGIVCLLVLTGLAGDPLAPPSTPDKSARSVTPTTAKAAVRRDALRDPKSPSPTTMPIGAKRPRELGSVSGGKTSATQPAGRRRSRPTQRMPLSDADPHQLPKRPARRNPGIPAQSPASQPEANEPVDYGEQDVVTRPDGAKAYRLRYKVHKGEKRYLIVENEYKDRGGIPGLLTYTAEAGNRITLEQNLDDAGKGIARRNSPNPNGKGPASPDRSTLIEWRVDRFEAHERALGDEHKFDTVRDSYPVAPLRRLGTANDAKVTFERDGWTGVAQRIRIQPGRSIGPATRRKLSKTTQKCLFDNTNVVQLLDDIGPLILPRTPRSVGESWTRTRDKEIRNFGKSVTTYTFTLDRIEDGPDGSVIAHVNISGDVALVPDPVPPAEEATSKDDDADAKSDDKASPKKKPGARRTHRPGQRRQNRPKAKRHDFKLDSAVVSGTYEFDVSHGMLLNLSLRRESALSAQMESKEMGDMSLENSEAHALRVKTTTIEPPKPMIVGGPKPPKDDPKDLVRPRTAKNDDRDRKGVANPTADRKRANAQNYAERRRKNRERLRLRQEAARKRRGLTTQPATSQPAWPPTRNLTTRPAPGRHKVATTQPFRPRPRPLTTRPAPVSGNRPTPQPPRPGPKITPECDD